MLERLIVLDKGLTIYQGEANKVEDYLTDIGVIPSQKMVISDFFMMEISAFKAKRYNYVTPFTSITYDYKLRISVDKAIDKV